MKLYETDSMYLGRYFLLESLLSEFNGRLILFLHCIKKYQRLHH